MDDKVVALLEKLAGKFGVTAEHLWGVMLVQAKVDAAISIVVAIVTVIGTVWLWKKANAITDSLDRAPAVIVVSIGAIVAFTFVAVLVGGAITGILNPEYWALRQIIK